MKISDLIGIFEGDDEEVTPEDERVAAISQLLIDKTDDANAPSKLSTDAFLNILQKMGMPITIEVLMDMVENGELKNIIKDVNQDEVIFKGKQDVEDAAGMTIDQAQKTVDSMAKRAAKKGIKK